MMGNDCTNGVCRVDPADLNSRVYFDIKLGEELDTMAIMESRMRVKVLFVDETYHIRCPICGGACVYRILGWKTTERLQPCPIMGIWRLDLPLEKLGFLKKMPVNGRVEYHT